MSTSTGSSLATLLMSVPLAAIPLMAIFGIPQFTEVVASPDNAGGDIIVGQHADASPSQNPASDRERSADLLDDAPAFATSESNLAEPLRNPFGPAANSLDAMGTVSGAPDADFHTDDNVHAGDRSEPFVSSVQGGARPGGHSIAAREFDTATSPDIAPRQMTWRAATRRLQELGIENYHLERGLSFESFLFVCSFEPAGTDNVQMRFEAEASDPLAAVADVLDQIDRWLRRSFAESRQASLLPGGSVP